LVWGNVTNIVSLRNESDGTSAQGGGAELLKGCRNRETGYSPTQSFQARISVAEGPESVEVQAARSAPWQRDRHPFADRLVALRSHRETAPAQVALLRSSELGQRPGAAVLHQLRRPPPIGLVSLRSTMLLPRERSGPPPPSKIAPAWCTGARVAVADGPASDDRPPEDIRAKHTESRRPARSAESASEIPALGDRAATKPPHRSRKNQHPLQDSCGGLPLQKLNWGRWPPPGIQGECRLAVFERRGDQHGVTAVVRGRHQALEAGRHPPHGQQHPRM